MRRALLTTAAAALLALTPGAALAAPGTGNGEGAGGVSGLSFYVDGVQYRTVGTPTDFSGTGAPDHSFDTIYAIDGQPNVATAAPGDDGYNGGRWRVEALAFDDYEAAVAAVDANGSGDIDSAAEVHDALGMGLATEEGVVRSFLCPVIPAHGPHL
jgi:hypothetical protein